MRTRTLLPLLGLAAAVALGPMAAATADGAHGPSGHGDGHHGWAFGQGEPPLGSVSALSATSLSVLQIDGSTKTYVLDANTKYFLDGNTVVPSSALIGDQVVVAFAHEGQQGAGGSSTTPTAQAVFFISAHLVGTVQSVTPTSAGETIVIADPQGFWHSISTSSTTGWYVSGSSVSAAPSVSVGQVVAALGVVDADHLTLDATQVNVNPKPGTPPAGGKPGGHH